MRADSVYTRAALGAAAALPWAWLEILARAELSAVALLAATLLGVCAGLLAGLAVAWIGNQRLLALALLAPAPLLFATTLHAAVLRAAEVTPLLGTTSVWSAAGALAASCGWLVRHTTARVRLSRRWQWFLAWACFAAVLALVLEPLQRHWMSLARTVPFLQAIAGLALCLVPRTRVLAAGAIALGSAAALSRLPEAYVELQIVLGWTCVGATLLVFRLTPDRVSQPLAAGAIRGHALLACVALVSGAAANLLVVHDEAVWRAAPHTRGMFSALARSGQRLSDFDGDGYGILFGQHDCAPLDATAAPGRHEIPGNDIDEDCLAGPARGERCAWSRTREAVHPPPRPWRGDIVLFVADTLREDTARDPSLVHLAALADRGVRFDRTYSTSSFTACVLPGLLAARLPSTVTMQWFAAFAGIPTEPVGGLAPMLAARGYDTGFAGGAAGRRYFDQDAFGNGFRVRRPLVVDAPPEALTAAAVATWNALDASRPRLLYVHSMWMHEARGGRDAYTRAATMLDAGLGALHEAIGDGPLWVVTADHGQEFYEHGGVHHARTLYGEVTHVPLVFSGANLPAGHVTTLTSLRAVMPTLVAMAAPATVPAGPGPYLCLGQTECRDMEAPMALELRHTHWHGLVRDHQSIYRQLDVDRVIAFDLADDPGEQRPLAVVPDALRQALIDWEQHAFGAKECAWPYQR